MIRLEKESKHSTEQVLERAIKYFGMKGVGLNLTMQTDVFVRFEGGGGYVEMAVKSKEKHTEIDIVAVEWEYQAKQFLGKI